jgi:hypothetical protein
LYEQVKTFVKKGQFVPIGGTWVEMVKLKFLENSEKILRIVIFLLENP